MQIEKFEISEDSRSVEWVYGGESKVLSFETPVFQAVHCEKYNSVIVIQDFEDVGPDNLFIYRGDGSVKSNPHIDKLVLEGRRIRGFYAIWYVEGVDEQIVVMIPEGMSDYDYRSSFNLESEAFSGLSLTK